MANIFKPRNVEKQAPAASAEPKSSRLAFLDWTRGLAALIMLQGHVYHSFTRTDQRNSDVFVLSQFVGGMPPAIFLFLTGVTFAFLMNSLERRSMSDGQRVWTALRRAGYLFAIAILFRMQLFVFAYPQSSWSSLLKVDILNCMALAIAVLSPLAVFTTAERVRAGAAAGLLIACLAPVVSMVDLGWMHPVLRSYIVPDYNMFGFFPWASFAAFGVAAGSILRLAPGEKTVQLMPWAAWIGLVMLVGAQYFSNLPYSLYPKSEFWLNGPTLILMKLGAILLLSCFAYLWVQYAAPKGWSWVRQFGTTSLLVYWVHTELVYGRWFGSWKENLSIGEVTMAAVSVILLMLALSVTRTRWKEWKISLPWWPSYAAQRASAE